MFCYFCMCYAGYDGIGETCWCWDAIPESDSWVMELAGWKTVDSTVLELWSDQWSLHQRCSYIWFCDVASPIPSWHRLRRGGVTFGRLAVIDFDGCHCLLIYCVVRFRTLVHFRLCRFQKCRWKFCQMYYLLYWLWYILDWNFRDARGVYNGRLCGWSFSFERWRGVGT